MANTNEAVTESVEAVKFSFMTEDEVHKLSVIRVTTPNLLDNVERPIPGGLYDPAFGPLDERSLCKSCGQRSFNCPGHCGHIDLVSPLYNPLLFNTLYNLLRKTCFFCHRLFASDVELGRCVSQMKLIAKGDVIGAKDLGSRLSYEVDETTKYLGAEHLNQEKWTSLQFTEAMSVLNSLSNPKANEACGYCSSKIVKLKKPTFGWFHTGPLNGRAIRANVIRGAPLEDSLGDEESLVEEEIIQEGDSDTNTQQSSAKRPKSKKGSDVTSEYINQRKTFSAGHLLPSEVKGILKHLWENEAKFFSILNDIHGQGIGSKDDYLMFFLHTILVPPIKFRAPSKGGDSVMEHPHTVLLNKVIQANDALKSAHQIKSDDAMNSSKIVQRWMDLQQAVNVMYDSKTASGKRNVSSGICQLLEKKEGLFRQKMMGKRVNFACRSVISPDPYLAVNEIGIPPYFAIRLTYPERVTPWNVAKLREAVINGPEVHPGATQYVDRSSTVKLLPNRKSRISTSRKLPSSRGVVVQNGKTVDYESEGKIVYRHLQDGDIVLVNRQPTLHKPSIMAHVVRVLKGEKTIRMHYANCSTYNADFDGDEMNVHFPQDEISRAEGYNILNANNQYVKPTSGEPVRALIQDHVVSAVLMSKKDTFLSRDEFNQLLFSSGLSSRGSGASSKKLGSKVHVPEFEAELQSLQPAIWKPEPLWTGKQVITALLNHITRGSLLFSVEKGGKIPRDFFNSTTVEDDHRRKREAETKGQEDEKERSKRRKANDGELKRRKDALKFKEDMNEDKLLIYKNTFVRGVIDKAQFGDYGLVHTVHELYGSNTAGLLLSALSRLLTVYLQMHGFTCGVDDLLIVKSKDMDRKRLLEKCEEIGEEVHRGFVGVEDQNLDPFSLQRRIEKTIHDDGEAALASLDRRMISRLNDITSKSEELKGLLSKGLHKPPSKNCISLMTTSGAKGGVVNFQQISSHLGQQELEGKRVPRMVSGKTLPCFPPWDWASRSGGLIIDRFLSGLRPQEFYFHCMAGREGLVDTAVKTSRSGYLQRCLIKNLESLTVNYDHTVRDADGSIIQFHYGEDGVDVSQTSFLANFEAMTTNEEMVKMKCCRQVDKSNPYIKELPPALKKKAVQYLSKLSEKHQNVSNEKDFLKLVEHKYLSSLAQPGEPVGVLAAQSVGEPSTQMTLNTFHLAGRGEMNVTLGIPRLQEILMTAAVNIKTPFMTCPLQEGRTEEDAADIVRKLTKVTVVDIIKSIKVTVDPFAYHKHKNICRIYKLAIKFYKPGQGPNTLVSSDKLEDALKDYVIKIEDAIQYQIKFSNRTRGIENVAVSQSEAENGGDENVSSDNSRLDQEEDDDGERSEAVDDLGSDAQKEKQRGTDEMEYEDGSEGEANEGDQTIQFRSESDDDDDDDDDDDGNGDGDGDGEGPSEDENLTDGPKETKSATKKRKKSFSVPNRKDSDRRIHVEVKNFKFTIHFAFETDEPHILLAQIAQNTAARVYVLESGKTDTCRQITCKESQVIYHGNDPKSRKEIAAADKEKIPALQTSGVDFLTFWRFEDVLDTRYIYSNNIHEVLKTYGVEAARETIIREVTNVFKSYGISVNIRHLTLIADFMTHTGGYRPMSRHGGIAGSTSPLGKMTFETASKFIVEAAYHREVDSLETPSSRICLGLPAKVGTGCFDLLHKAEI